MAIETERKYLIKMPSEAVTSPLIKSEIEQIYIKSNDFYDSSRIRRREYTDRVVYYMTGKKKLTDMSAVEDEREISAEEYCELARLAEEGTRPIIKTRYVLPYRGYDFEIDVYPFWNDRAVMEVELPSEDAEFILPPGIEIIKEVTGDRRYTNHALSYNIPNDVI